MFVRRQLFLLGFNLVIECSEPIVPHSAVIGECCSIVSV